MTRLRRFRKCALDGAIERWGEIFTELRDLFVEMMLVIFRCTVSRKRRVSSQRVVCEDAEGIDIRSCADGAGATPLFRRHVGPRTNSGTRWREPPVISTWVSASHSFERNVCLRR